MTERPLISVIVPVYNVERYLPECIESICAQTYANLEIILVDDGATDNSPAICENYAVTDPRISVIHKENGGLSTARNVGLDTAKGDYIGFVDGDDCIEANMYETLLRACYTASADMCMCKHKNINELSEQHDSGSGYGQKESIVTGQELLRRLAYSVDIDYVVVWNKLVRKDIMTQLRFVEGKQHEDEYIIHHLYGACEKVVLLDEPLYLYRIRAGSVMRVNISVKRLDAMDAYVDRVDYLLAQNCPALAAHVLGRATSLLVRLYMGMESVDAETRRKISSVRSVFRQLRKQIPEGHLSVRDDVELFLGLQALPVYAVALKMRGRISGRETL